MSVDYRLLAAGCIFVAALVFFWLLGAFVGLEINPLRWSLGGRVAYAALAVPFSAWLSAFPLVFWDARP